MREHVSAQHRAQYSMDVAVILSSLSSKAVFSCVKMPHLYSSSLIMAETVACLHFKAFEMGF